MNMKENLINQGRKIAEVKVDRIYSRSDIKDG